MDCMDKYGNYGFVWKLFVFYMDFWTPFLGFS